MINKKKKGMSEIMIAVLLILLVTTTIAAVFIWNKKIFSSLTSDSKGCSELSFNLGDFCYEEQTILGEVKTRLKFNVRNELEDKEISGFIIFLDDNYGNTQTISDLASTSIIGFETKSLTTNFFSNSGISTVRISPQITEEDEIILCEEKQTTIKWSTIDECS